MEEERAEGGPHQPADSSADANMLVGDVASAIEETGQQPKRPEHEEQHEEIRDGHFLLPTVTEISTISVMIGLN